MHAFGCRFRVILLCLIFLAFGCSSSGRPFGDDAGHDQVVELLDVRHADVACAGCWADGTCIPPEQQTEDRCGAPDGPCGPTRLECSGIPGSCPQGSQLATRHQCGEPAGQSITRPVCCPVNVCTYDACR